MVGSNLVNILIGLLPLVFLGLLIAGFYQLAKDEDQRAELLATLGVESFTDPAGHQYLTRVGWSLRLWSSERYPWAWLAIAY